MPKTAYEMGVCAIGLDISKCVSAYRSLIRDNCADKPFFRVKQVPRGSSRRYATG